jgi:general secretion pathway protein B
MSYILDALRRADAERERGSVPGIHAQPAVLGEADNDQRRAPRASLWLGAGCGLLMLAALAWWFVGRDTPRPATEPVPATPLPVTVAPVALVPAPASAPASATTSASASATTPATAPVPTPLAEAPRKAPPKLAAAAPVKAPAAASKPVARVAADETPAPGAIEARVYTLSELPDEIRRELPQLATGGAMYSQNPSNRLLIVNGQAFHEGDKLAPGLTLEQIKLKSAVLEYKGYRYGITY